MTSLVVRPEDCEYRTGGPVDILDIPMSYAKIVRGPFAGVELNASTHWRHVARGTFYRIVAFGALEATGEVSVSYVPVTLRDGRFQEAGTMWTRSLGVFLEGTGAQGATPRFERAL